MAVWIDQNQAKIFHVDSLAFDEATIQSPKDHVHRHPKDQLTRNHDHPDDQQRFFHEVAEKLAGADQVLLMGPSVTKLHLLRYAEKHDALLASRVVGVETADQATDRQLVAHVRQYFHSDLPRHGTTPA